MKISPFVAVVVVIVTIVTIGLVNGQKENRIVAGSIANERQFPYVVSLRRNDMHTCGGVIISRNYILTAGRCVVQKFGSNGVESYPPSEFNIRAGSLTLYEEGILEGVAEIKVHTNYTNMLSDLALLKLKQPLIFSDYIQPINLPSMAISAPTSHVSVPGWGLQKTSGDNSRQLKYLSMEVVASAKCLTYLYGEDADKKIICLEYNGGGICSGDIGGPAVYGEDLVGLASFTIERCGSEYPDGFTNIGYYTQWIRENSDLK
ncbi:serine protease SP24D-like [Musca vetustissima]|uniref:serine protease SP24D-like n=1 Tax=Musca vetustissima TaxID=27455 RepID=UPI002AB602EA|nr:serine protease SP24D-like [Musca vetustissima]